MLNGGARGALQPQAQPPSSCHACTCRRLLSRRGPEGRRSVDCAAVPAEALQDILVGSAVLAAASVAVYSGLKKDPVPCSLCMGLGGIKCFGCDGDGKKESVSRDSLYEGPPPKRDLFGRSPNPRECRVCKGVGLVLCSQCKGSGFQSMF
ncbi:hypothetical protein TSOC_007046 [Tetrabaena socialis]|uniref:Uncharacterized protein n=1 Tax=Tetrabaena socialis TaxID=47790 RepID=A0A2J8A279_9CHLO|nr:hypothetical protein TSOC_007046 [Tetrabaena socialis]|eukprot:PNH06605.1 hypothetical protein TSOC_007046 [Tetrabaena socialis]